MDPFSGSIRSKHQLNDSIINTILIVAALLAVLALISAGIRALTIGWSYRDVIQWIVVSGIVGLALARRMIPPDRKAFLLIVLFSLGGFSGFYTLGMMGGTIFIFATAMVVVAVFYSPRFSWGYTLLCIVLSGLVAYRFCSGLAAIPSGAESLISDSTHWLAYILCMLFFFSVTGVTIHAYHTATTALLNKIKDQRDELIRVNEELVQASKNVKILNGLLPICASCKKIRDGKGYWNRLESYIIKHSEADFTHSICPQCMETLYPDERDEEDANPTH